MGMGEGTQSQARAQRVLVLGGAGFIGRHAVAALLDAGVDVLIGSRHPNRINRRLPQQALDCARCEVHFEEMIDADHWQSLVTDVDVVLNCVGILRQRGRETYQRVHERAPAALAAACARHGKRLVHVSAMGLNGAVRSRFLTSKRSGERAIRDACGDWIIVRPSLLDGRGGYGAWWLRMVARLPMFAVPADASGRIAALDVAELGEALTRLCLGAEGELQLSRSREFDLGGEVALSLRDYMQALRRRDGRRQAWCIPVPGLIARAVAHVCDLLHATPFSYGHWELLRQDNVPTWNRLPELLGRPPRIIGKLAEDAAITTRVES